MTGCSCIRKRIRTVNPNANAKPITSNSAALYHPGARSFAGRGTRLRLGPVTGSGAGAVVVAISGAPSLHTTHSCGSSIRPLPTGYPSFGHARNEVHECLDLGLRQLLREGLGHDVGLIAGRNVGVWLRDRF